jgi:hypothetical protein
MGNGIEGDQVGGQSVGDNFWWLWWLAFHPVGPMLQGFIDVEVLFSSHFSEPLLLYSPILYHPNTHPMKEGLWCFMEGVPSGALPFSFMLLAFWKCTFKDLLWKFPVCYRHIWRLNTTCHLDAHVNSQHSLFREQDRQESKLHLNGNEKDQASTSKVVMFVQQTETEITSLWLVREHDIHPGPSRKLNVDNDKVNKQNSWGI